MDTQVEWDRLREVYAGMVDAELLELAAKPEELTEIAQEVLEREMTTRKLMPPAQDAGAELEPEPEATGPVFRTNLTLHASTAASLMTLYDALQTSDACTYLEQEEVPFEVRDLSDREAGFHTFGNGPAIAFEFLVPASELERAKQVLRDRMGLFPVQEVAVADEPVDDGTLSILGCFATVQEAEEVAAGLREAGFWCVVTDESESEDRDEEYPVLLQVKEVDLLKAVAAIEASGEVVEGSDLDAE